MSLTSQHFDRFRLKGWQLWLNKDFPVARNLDADNILKIENRKLKISDGIRGPVTAIPASDFARVFRGLLNFHGAEHRLILKEYLHRSFVDILKHLFIPGRAQRACVASVALLDHGIPCPPVVALGLKKLGLIPLSSFLITEEITDAPDIYAWLTQTWLNAGDSVRMIRRQFITALGSTIGRMHAAGIAHGDLRPRNILARLESGRWTFYLLDNERTRQFRRLPDRLRQKNLHQIGMFPLGVSRSDRWRFYRAYLAENPGLQADPKPLARAVETLTSVRLARKKSESARFFRT
jgi:tRNA A-37 threonylcarbamoyl transferase component Bud32